jgi:maleamate amidohydrolase
LEGEIMAVWDQFLTERDKEHLIASERGERPFKAFGKRPALLIIDDYYGVLGTQPEDILESVKTWPSSCGLEGWEAINRTQELLASARANKIPVIFVTGLGKEFPAQWGNHEKGSTKLTAEQQEISLKIPDEIAPQPGELVIKKASPSAFWGTPLIGHLIYNQIDTVIACGETVSGCLRASVVDGCTYRFTMGVVEECSFDRTQASHAMNLFDMHQKYAKVITMPEAVQYFDTIGESR